MEKVIRNNLITKFRVALTFEAICLSFKLIDTAYSAALLIQIMLQRGPVLYNQQLNWRENNNTPTNEFLPMNSPIRHLQLERDFEIILAFDEKGKACNKQNLRVFLQ